MSPQLFRRQLDAGAWGLTFATVTQAARRRRGRRPARADRQPGGGRRRTWPACRRCWRTHADLRIVFLVDSAAQLDLIEGWLPAHPAARPFEVLLEWAWPGAAPVAATTRRQWRWRRGCMRSAAVRLVGIECYEGLWAKGTTAADAPFVGALMDRVEALARACESSSLFDADEVLVSAGGSAMFDLVAGRLKPTLGRPVRGLLRSGCYLTHDHGQYQGMVAEVERRMRLRRRPEPARGAARCGHWCSRCPSRAWRFSARASATFPTTWHCRCRSRAPHRPA